MRYRPGALWTGSAQVEGLLRRGPSPRGPSRRAMNSDATSAPEAGEGTHKPLPPYKLIDIGANLHSHRFPAKELPDIVQRSRDAGIVKIMVTGTSVKESEEALRLARLHPGFLYATAGVHPHDAKTWTDGTLQSLRDLAQEPEVVAIGECGLDFNRNFSPAEDQRKAFRAQVGLAVELALPLFVHERDAAEEMVEILSSFPNLPPTVIHCFTGTAAQAQTYLNMGLYIGLTGFLWKDRSDDGVQYALRNGLLPLERLLVETDAPFMFPNVSHKKLPEEVRNGLSEHARSLLKRHCSFKRNEPCALAAVTELIAAFAGKSPQDVALNTTINALKVFPRLAE